jgi:hypothetical protein
MALGMVPSDSDSAAKAFADLKLSWQKRKAPGRRHRLKSKHSPGSLEI